MTNIKIPRENANDDTVLITKVFFKNGDIVKKGQILFEFETSKAAIEFEAPCDGNLSNFILSEGLQISVDSIIGNLNDKNEIALDNSTTNDLGPLDTDKPINDAAHFSNAANDFLKEGKIPVESNQWITTSNFRDKK